MFERRLFVLITVQLQGSLMMLSVTEATEATFRFSYLAIGIHITKIEELPRLSGHYGSQYSRFVLERHCRAVLLRFTL